MALGAANICVGSRLDGHSSVVCQSEGQSIGELVIRVARLHGVFKSSQHFPGVGHPGTNEFPVGDGSDTCRYAGAVFRDVVGSNEELAVATLEAVDAVKSDSQLLGPGNICCDAICPLVILGSFCIF